MPEPTWEIRPIKPESLFKWNWCTEGACHEPATHYLVMHPNWPLAQRESRSRRCEKHAREDAKSLRIVFPEHVVVEAPHV